MARSPANPWQPGDTDILATLRDAAFEQMRALPDSSNFVLLAELEHPLRGRGLGVYKPVRGERPLSDFPAGTLHHREVAAFELSQLLGWGVVPPTIECEGPHGTGSLQLFVEHDPNEHYFVLREDEALWSQLVRLAVFDLVVNNADRKGGHVLSDAARHLWAIDNGLTFHPQEKLRTVIWDFAGTMISKSLLDDLQRVRNCVAAAGDEAAPLLARLRAREPAALRERIDRVLGEPRLPEMYPWRCTPWPLI